ncbi:flagellar basal body rod protein FlgC [Pinisolibacter sp.]|uniref:flagellar basal body rod protein FlgC n=1 Tax=Pinisolibacter sp. TaxID=2172024 RepID=UPI002FDD548B
MSLFSAMSIARSGLDASTRRLEAAASNIANQRTTGPVPGADGATTAYRALAVRETDLPGGGVRTEIVPRSPGWTVEPGPGDPNADERGLVAAPNVDIVTETSDLLMARIGYAAAAKVMKVADDMQKTATDMFV